MIHGHGLGLGRSGTFTTPTLQHVSADRKQRSMLFAQRPEPVRTEELPTVECEWSHGKQRSRAGHSIAHVRAAHVRNYVCQRTIGTHPQSRCSSSLDVEDLSPLYRFPRSTRGPEDCYISARLDRLVRARLAEVSCIKMIGSSSKGRHVVPESGRGSSLTRAEEDADEDVLVVEVPALLIRVTLDSVIFADTRS